MCDGKVIIDMAVILYHFKKYSVSVNGSLLIMSINKYQVMDSFRFIKLRDFKFHIDFELGNVKLRNLTSHAFGHE